MMRSYFKACKDCTRQCKRPGCHDECPDYQAEKAAYNAAKGADDQKRHIHNDIYDQRGKRVAQALKRRGGY